MTVKHPHVSWLFNAMAIYSYCNLSRLSTIMHTLLLHESRFYDSHYINLFAFCHFRGSCLRDGNYRGLLSSCDSGFKYRASEVIHSPALTGSHVPLVLRKPLRRHGYYQRRHHHAAHGQKHG